MSKFARQGSYMLRGVLGKKIGMTQIFADQKVVPVTVVDLNHWYVTNIRTKDKDGYNAVQVGHLRKKYQNQQFSLEWLKKLKSYFSVVQEIEQTEQAAMEVGKPVDFTTLIQAGQAVDVFGTTKGRGFQGVVKRHGFAGGSASHGPRFGRIPGSVSFMRSRGRVIKGKRLPGHMGVQRRVAKYLEIVKVEPETKIALVKGSVPGGSGSLVYIQKYK